MFRELLGSYERGSCLQSFHFQKHHKRWNCKWRFLDSFLPFAWTNPFWLASVEPDTTYPMVILFYCLRLKTMTYMSDQKSMRCFFPWNFLASIIQHCDPSVLIWESSWLNALKLDMKGSDRKIKGPRERKNSLFAFQHHFLKCIFGEKITNEKRCEIILWFAWTNSCVDLLSNFKKGRINIQQLSFAFSHHAAVDGSMREFKITLVW